MNKKWMPRPHTVSGIFIFLLIGIFAVTSLTLTLIGTRVYQHVTASAEANSESRLMLSYLCNKVRTYDAVGKIELKEQGGLSTLCLYENYDGDRFETSIYVYDGQLRERLAAVEEPFDPEEGEALMEAEALAFRWLSPRLLELSIQLNGESETLRVALRTVGEEAQE